jgi:hypothetical protein
LFRETEDAAIIGDRAIAYLETGAAVNAVPNTDRDIKKRRIFHDQGINGAVF